MTSTLCASKRDSLERSVLYVIIRRLWWRERMLGHYTPTKELCLDLAQLPTTELIVLRRQVRQRLQRWLREGAHDSPRRVAA